MDKLAEDIKALADRLTAIDAEQKVMVDKANADQSGKFTEEQRVAFDALSAEYDTKSEEIETLKADFKRQQDRQSRQKPDTTIPRRTAANVNTPLQEANAGHESPASKVVVIPATVKRAGSLKNFQGTRGGLDAEQRAYRFGMFALAKASMDMPSRFRFQSAVDFTRDQWAIHTENGVDNGSVWVPDEFGTDLIDLREQYGVIRRLFKVRPMSSDTRSDPRRKGGLTAHFVGEANAGTESTKAWDRVQLVAKKIMVISRYTNELNMDAVISIGDDLAGEIAYAFAYKEDDCGLNGDGSSTYGGIVGARAALNTAAGNPTTTSAGGVVIATGNAYSEITLSDFQKVLGALPQYAMTPSTRWVASQSFFYTVMNRLELAAGGTTATEIRDGVPGYRFLGLPVEVSQAMPTTEANSQICCLLGDFAKGASFGDRRKEAIDFSEHATVGGESLWERDEIGIKGSERFDINVHDVGTSTAAGPIVGLKTLNA